MVLSPLTRKPFRSRTILDGILDPVEQAAIAAELPGRLVSVSVRAGDSVLKGEELARIDPTESQATLEFAEAELRGAQARLEELLSGPRSEILRNLDHQVQLARTEEALATTELARTQKLFHKSAATQEQWDQAKARLDSAKASVQSHLARQDEALAGTRKERIRQAQAQRDKAQAAQKQALKKVTSQRILAPFAGVVVAPPLSAGAYVSVGTPLLRLIANDVLEARAGVPERFLEEFSPGAPIEILIHDQRIQTTVSSLEPAIEPHTRTFMVRARFKNPDKTFRVGQSIYMVAYAPARMAWILPPQAVLPTPGGELAVFVAKRDSPRSPCIASRKTIQGKWLKDGRIEILSGLKEGDTVVLQGAGWLLDGDPVKEVQL